MNNPQQQPKTKLHSAHDGNKSAYKIQSVSIYMYM